MQKSFLDFSSLENKRILVTGACGTVGRELLDQLLRKHQAAEILAIDNNESELFFWKERYCQYDNISFFLGDVRDRDKLIRRSRGVDLLFHCAAYKHVEICEISPFEAVQTNILGVQNVILGAFENDVKRVIFTSSDKAVNPTNVMGTSKLMGERLITAANSGWKQGTTVFSSVRFGNVLGSRGSVIPIFIEQIKNGGPVTLTDPKMTRFIMTIEDSVRLLVDAALLARGGEVFITKMLAIRIQDLAEVMIGELASGYGHAAVDVQVKIVGPRPGEKMYEELMNQEETRRAWELTNYFVVLPAFTSFYKDVSYAYPDIVAKDVTSPYHSENETQLSKDQLAQFLRINNLLEGDPRANDYGLLGDIGDEANTGTS
jgi:FlaA1/EpsC-like NDP-sugar epimerase